MLRTICLNWTTDAVHVPYAVALAKLFDATLFVGYDFQKRHTTSQDLQDETSRRIFDAVLNEMQEHVGLGTIVSSGEVVPAHLKETGILVSSRIAKHDFLPIWNPAFETGLRGTNSPVFVPFGNEPELEQKHEWSVQLAKKIGRPLVFYHTTWKKSGVTSDNPHDHWHSGAKDVARRIEKYAQTNSVPFKTIVETAPSVTQGIHEAALRERALVVVMQRGKNVIAGSYEEQLVSRPLLVPLIVLNTEEGDE